MSTVAFILRDKGGEVVTTGSAQVQLPLEVGSHLEVEDGLEVEVTKLATSKGGCFSFANPIIEVTIL